MAVAGAGRADQRQNGIHHGFTHRHAADKALDLQQPRGIDHRLGMAFGGARGFQKDPALGGEFGIFDIDFHQEAVKLGFGQRIGAFLLNRVLCREHMERLR